VKAEQIAEGLKFPEGPVWAGGALYFTEIAAGRVCRWTAAGGVERIAETGGGPNGATLGADGNLYITQNGGLGRDQAARVPGAIQRVSLGGSVQLVTNAVAGIKLDAPNDLAFGPDGRLYPNGIGFDAAGALVWVESFSRKGYRLIDGRAEPLFELPERHFPDGFCFDASGRMYVASTYAHCVSVIERGRLVERFVCHEKGMVTNCCFGGTDLYVTESRIGTLWRIALGVQPLALRA